MSEWKEYKLGDVITLQRGHDLPKTEMVNGEFPVAGSNGIIGFHNKSTTKGPGLTIGRSGNIGTPIFYSKDYWAHNTVLYVKDFKNSFPKFIYYFLSTFDFTQFNAGSAVPTLNRNHIHELNVKIPPLPEQKSIAEILSSLDDKIDLLHRQNKTLELLAETLFRQWFGRSEKLEMKSEKLGSVVEFAKGKKPNEVSENYFEGSIKQLLIETLDTGKTYYTKPNGMLVANEKDILMVMDGASSGRVEIGFTGAVGSTIGLFKPKKGFDFPLFLFHFLKSNEEYVKENTTGSAIPHADKALILNLEFYYSDKNEISEFENIATTWFEKTKSNRNQIKTLTKLRDLLLPKLMKGEIEFNKLPKFA